VNVSQLKGVSNTVDLGLNFDGDIGTPVNRTLGQTLNVKGGATTDLSDNNIGVEADGSNTLTVKLAENLTGLTSVTTGNTVMSNGGVTFLGSSVSLSGAGLNNGGNQIKGVGAGVAPDDAVNVSQLGSAISSNKTKYYSVKSTGGDNELNDGATGINAMAMGKNAKAQGSQTIAIGSNTTGQDTIASGEQSIAIGANVVSSGASSIAVGGDDLDAASRTNIDGTLSTGALNSGGVNTAFNDYTGQDLLNTSDKYGGHTEAGGAASIAMGAKARSAGHLATAIGIHSNAAGTASSAFGVGSSASAQGALALGAGATASVQEGVALGARSVANVGGGATGFTPISASSVDQSAIAATNSTTLGAVSVGSAKDGTRQIVNLAAGTNDSDAVNVSQLKGVSNTVDLGLNFDGDIGTPVNRTLGQTLNVKGGATGTLTTGNIGVVADGNNTLNIQLAKNIDLGTTGSVKMGSSSPFGFSDTTTLDRSGLTTGNILTKTTVDGLGVRTGNVLVNTTVTGAGIAVSSPLSTTIISSNGLTILNGPSITKSGGINAGNRRIVNVDDGVDPLDAVNFSQLEGFSAAAKTEVAAGTNVADVVKTTGGNGQDVYTVNANGSKTSAGSAAVEVSSTTDTTNNLTDYAVDLSQASKDSLLKADNSVQYDNAITRDIVTLGGVGATGPVTMTNVATGDVSEDSTDAVNGSQLHATNTQISKGFGLKAADGQTIMKQLGEQVKIVGSNSNIDTQVNTVDGTVEIALNDNLDLGNNGTVTTGNLLSGTNVNRLGMVTGGLLTGGVTTVSGAGVTVTGLNPFNPSSAALTSNGLTILNGPSITKSGGINAGNRRIVNVDDGVDPLDAVNFSQLEGFSAAAKTEVAAGTNVADVVKTTGGNGQDVYTVNANGSKTSAGSAAVEVSSTTDTTNNLTDYAVDLSQASKDSLLKADSAMQKIVTQINGNDVKTLDKTDNKANFVTGSNIVLSEDNGGIKIATTDEVVFTSVTTGDTLLNNDGVTLVGGSNQTVTLSNNGLNNGGNIITNVGDGEEDTDAVNIRQLNATNSTVDLGLDFTGDDTTVIVNRKLGETLTIQGGATDLTENNIGVVADEDGNLNVKLNKDVRLGETGSVRMESTVLNNAGITITDGPNETITLSNEGLDNGNNRIIKVAQGIAPTDAVNFAQLTMTNDEIAKGIYIGDGNSDNAQQFALGDTINVTGDSNITTIASTTGVQVKLNNQLNLSDEGNIQIGNTIMNNTGFTFIGNKPEDTVILGAGGLNNGFNRITNVAAGIDFTDAATVGQLEAATYSLDQGWGLSAQGDNATMVKQGSAVDINSRDGNITISRTLANGSLARQAGRAADVNDISFDLNRDISVDSLQTGDSTMTSDGLTIVGGPSVTKAGIDAAGTKITNVMNGDVSESSQDAINGGQLYAQGSGISSIIGGDTVYNPVDGTFTNNNIGGTGENNIDGAIASIKRGETIINENIQTNTTNIETNTTNIATNTADIVTNTTNIETNTTNIKVNKDKIDAGLNFGADSGANINKPVGDGNVLSFKGGNNITTTAQGSSIKFDLNGNINIDSVTTGNTTINNSGVSIAGGPSMTAAGIYAGNVETGPSMTTDGIYAGGKTITGVADGVAATDAVNIGQLSALDNRLNNNMNDLGYKIGEVEDDANAGISAAMAMSSLPQAFIPGKSLIGGGIGTYNGESAVAIGFSKLSNDGRWVMKINGTADTQGNAGGSIGAGFHFD
ncbi:YadA-like family protein, partial [Psychrobacter sp. APC 3426]|uniref:beta strand repeat-containing protein n=1 Tax=Psychrobacter sp. APC 3426 TaxID=3035177 RepID=UPI0025B3E64F